MKRAPWLAVAAVAAAAMLARPARAGDPTRVWRTIESEHFVVHYYEPNADVGRRVALVAERAHRTLASALDHVPAEKCHILLLDDTDGANGFANVLPRNSITLFATAPAGGSTLNDHDDWLYSLTAHEYAHVLHLDTIEGLPYWYNKVFGKTWAPNQVMPRWVIEGIATYEETKRSAGGRGRNATFDMFLRVPVLQDELLTLDQTTGAPRKFPRGNAAYLYGGKFLEYVFDRYGDDTLRAMSHASARHPLPFAVNRQIASVVGKSFDALYGDWEHHLRDRYALQAEAIDRRGRRDGRLLTADDSNTDVAPVYGADGKELYWLRSDGYERARIHVMPIGGDSRVARPLQQIDGLGAWTLAPDGSIAFEQSRVYRRDYSFQDVSYWDRRDDRTIRITVGKRAQDPAVSPDGREVAFAMNASARRVVAVAPIAPDAEPTVVWRGAGRYDQAFAPAWSPDGTRLAFSAWRDGGFRDILVVDRRTGAVEELTRDRAIDGSPTWSADGRYIYFDSDRTGVSNIYAWDTIERRLWQVTNVLGGALEASASPDGRRLAYHDFTGEGFDLKEVDLDPATWRPARAYIDVRPEPTVIRDDEAAVTRPRPYRALETLAPQAWTGQLTLGTLERAASVTTQGSDIAGLHGYSFGASIDLERGDVDFGASYGYTKLRIPFRISGARSVTRRGGYRIEDVNRLFDEEQLGATLSFGIPAERWPGGNWALSFDYDLDWSRALTDPLMEHDPNDNIPVKPLTDVVQAGVAARLSFGSASGALYPTGPQLRLRARGVDARRPPVGRRRLPRAHRELERAHLYRSAVGEDADDHGALRRRGAHERHPAHRRVLARRRAAPRRRPGDHRQRAGRQHRRPARLPGAGGHRQPVPPAQRRVPARALQHRARALDLARLLQARARRRPRRHRHRLGPRSGVGPGQDLRRRRAPHRRVLRVLRARDVRARLRARADRRGDQRDLVHAVRDDLTRA